MDLNLEPRAYQSAIVETAKSANTLVVLPTGLGKTAIALLLAVHRLKKLPLSKVLVLAPTRPLAAQHFETFKKSLPDLFGELVLFTGKVPSEKRQLLWKSADIIFSTPQCITNDLRKNRIDLKEVSLLIEDEAHRCLKNYDYTFVARRYLETAPGGRILGLTASPGSDPAVIKTVCQNLGIEKVEVRSRYSEDVKPYIQELKKEIIKVELPDQLKKIRDVFAELYQKKIQELKNRKLLFAPATKKALLELQARLQKAISEGNRHFNTLSGVSACAQAIKLGHAIELVETQGITPTYSYMLNLYEQAKEGRSRAVKQIVKNPSFQSAYTAILELHDKKFEHPKLAKLKEVITRELEENSKAKIILFAQYRDSIAKICKELNKLANIKARVFVGQQGETGLTQKEQQAVLEEFRQGKTNILCATSIGEEGLDIPEVNAVIFYEPIPSAIRQIQRRGRTARLMPGKLIVLLTKATRDEAYYWAAFHKERRMYGVLGSMQKQFAKEKKQKSQLKLDIFKNENEDKDSS